MKVACPIKEMELVSRGTTSWKRAYSAVCFREGGPDHVLFCCVLLPKTASCMASRQPTRPECTPTPRHEASLSPYCLRGYATLILLCRLNAAINRLLFLEWTFQKLGPRYFTGTLPGICLLLVTLDFHAQELQPSTNKNLKMEIGNVAIISCILPSSYWRLRNPGITTSDFTYN